MGQIEWGQDHTLPTLDELGAAASGHDHAGVYEPADADIAKVNEVETITGAWEFEVNLVLRDGFELQVENNAGTPIRALFVDHDVGRYAIGQNTLLGPAAGSNHFAFGGFALSLGTGTVNDTVALGAYAGFRAGSGGSANSNFFLGTYSGQHLNFGSDNVAIGASSMRMLASAGSGVNNIGGNIAIGSNALNNLSASQVNNVAIGNSALSATGATGHSRTVAIGTRAGSTALATTNAILLGYQAGNSAASYSSRLIIGYDAPVTNAAIIDGTMPNTSLRFNATTINLSFINPAAAVQPTTVNIANTNASSAVGFFGITAQTRKTIAGSRGGNAALADLLTQLAAMGLIIDGTTP